MPTFGLVFVGAATGIGAGWNGLHPDVQMNLEMVTFVPSTIPATSFWQKMAYKPLALSLLGLTL